MTAQIVSLDAHRKRLASDLLQSKRPCAKGRGMSAMLRREDGRWADHRDEPRHAVDGVSMPLMMVDGQEALLKEVSRSGLRVQSSIVASPGSRVLLEIPGCAPVPARVIWNQDEVIGLEAPMASSLALR